MSNSETARRTALIVEDEVAVRNLLNEILTEAGFNTTCVELGEVALKTIDQQEFDLLVIDIGLPDISGMVVCDHARAHYGDGVAIVIVTANSNLERLRTAVAVGADDFVPKPFDIDELLTRIEIKLRRATEVRTTG